MQQVEVPERASWFALSTTSSRHLVKNNLTLSINSLYSILRSLEVFDAAYWDTRRQSLGFELELQEIRMLEEKELHLKEGGSLTDPAWILKSERYEAEIRSIEDAIRVARKEPELILQDARNRAKHPRPRNLLAEKAFVESQLECFQGTGAQDGTAQSKFRHDLVEVYNSEHPDQQSIWCPVLHTFDDNTDNRVAAHIFPRRLGLRLMNLIFGPEAEEDLFGVRNGMIISAPIKAKFDKFQVVIVPAQPRTEAHAVDDWVLRTVNHQIDDYKVHEIGKTFKEIDGRPLVFRSNARPAARYLYFHYVVSMLLAKSDRNRKTGVISIASEDIVWATPGKYLRQNMLAALIREFGDVDPTATEAFQEHAIGETDGSSSEDVKRLSRKVVSVCQERTEEDN
ncbi:MAG: hypothetical protein LQ347_002978 [Umbilicaria vellea]|nr:MAG: hypothetical protein LQ347_002978 [Umbilicaria vellea]